MVNRSFRKRYPKTARAMRYTGNALKMAGHAYSMARTVASIINSEKKFHDTSINYNPDVNASITCLTNMSQGSTEVTRTGNTVALKSLELRGWLKWDDTTANGIMEYVRVALVVDYNNNAGTPPTYTDIWLNSDPHVNFRNMDNRRRFKVLMDKVYSADGQKHIRLVEKFKRFKMKKDKHGNPTVSTKVYFDGSTGNDYTKNHIFLVIMGSSATAQTASATSFVSRIRYYDN